MGERAIGIDFSSELQELDTVCRAGFSTLVERLVDIRDTGGALVSHLEQLAELALRNKGVGEARGLLETLTNAKTMFHGVAGPQQTHSIRKLGFVLAQEMHTVRLRGTMLWAVSSKFRSEAATIERSTFEHYAGILRSVAQTLIDNSDRVSTQVAEVQTRDKAFLTAATDAANSLNILDAKIRNPVVKTRQLIRETVEKGGRLSAKSEEHKSRFQNDINAMIQVIQFSDRMDQRLDHISQICGYGPGYGGLAAAQLQALARDLNATMREASLHLSGLENASRETNSKINIADYCDAMGEAIRFQSGTLESAIEHSEPVKSATEEAEANVAHLERALADVARSFATFKTVYAEISAASHNSMIMAKREAGDARDALVVLSGAVNDAGSDCMRAIRTSETALDDLNGHSVDRSTQIKDKLDAFTDKLVLAFADLSEIESARTELSKIEQAMQSVRGDFNSAISVADDSVQQLLELPARLRTIAKKIDSGAPPPKTHLAKIRAMYSMETEREVHDACVSGGVQHIAAPPPVEQARAGAADVDIDDIFF